MPSRTGNERFHLKVPMNRCAGSKLGRSVFASPSFRETQPRRANAKGRAGLAYAFFRRFVPALGKTSATSGLKPPTSAPIRRVVARSLPLEERRPNREAFARRFFRKEVISPSAATTTLGNAKRWLAGVGGSLDGIVAKRLNNIIGQATAADGRIISKRARERDTSKATTPAAGAAGVQVEEATPIVAYAGTQVALALSYL
jgi:hypothetical protein